VVIVCALVLGPQFIIADEPVSMLDVSIRAEILNLLRGLRDERGISMLFITHDLSTAAYFTDRVAVMYLGCIVEIGPTREVLSKPKHPYTQALLSVIPVPNPRLRRKRMILQGETPNPIDLPGGCRFHPRCPLARPLQRERSTARGRGAGPPGSLLFSLVTAFVTWPCRFTSMRSKRMAVAFFCADGGSCLPGIWI